MTKQELKALFPLKIYTSQEILDNKLNIGLQLLNSVFSQYEVFWGLSIGSISWCGENPLTLLLKTEKTIVYNGITMSVPLYLQASEITEPCYIEFKLRN